MAFECLLGVSPNDCAVPPKSDLDHVTQLVALDFLTSKSTRADFAVTDTDMQLQIEAHAPGVYRLRCAQASVLHNEKPSARTRAHIEMLLARQEPVGELAVSSIAEAPHSGWRYQQGDITLEVTQSPLQLFVYRGEDCVLSTPEL